MTQRSFGNDANRLGPEVEICCALGCDAPTIIAAGATPMCQKHMIDAYRAIGEYLRSQQGKAVDEDQWLEKWLETYETLRPPLVCRMCNWRILRHRESGEVACMNSDCGWWCPADEFADWTARVMAAEMEIIEVVYYVRFGDRVKIGTTKNLEKRLPHIPHDEVMATEPGGIYVERQRHQQFRHIRAHVGHGREWFTLTPELAEHIAAVRARQDVAA